MTAYIYDYTCKYSVFILIIYGYNHKNYNANTIYMAYKMAIEF